MLISERAKQLVRQLCYPLKDEKVSDLIQATLDAHAEEAIIAARRETHEAERRAEWYRLLLDIARSGFVGYEDEAITGWLPHEKLGTEKFIAPCTFDPQGYPVWTAELEQQLRELL